MGNEGSQLSGLQIEEKPVEITDFWSHYQATITDSCRYFSLKCDGSVSVFKGEAVLGPLWAVSTPLEKCSNNLLKYRHPCIVRYISAWQQRSTLHLATEYIQPLNQVLSTFTPLQICVGLNNILRALVFLHDQAYMSHNNISIPAIYVSGDGSWKLGGLQYLCSFKELTSAYLKHARIHRYDKAVDPNEESHDTTSKVDQYGFGVLVEDVFKTCKDDDVPFLKEFKQYCREVLRHVNPSQRPKLSDVLSHSFFNHEFISIYKFLNFLPIKMEDEKHQFFSTILENLQNFDEETVAKQLGGMLLSRLTMLDQTARKDVIPYIFQPKNERMQNADRPGVFSLGVFKEHVKPRIMQMFGVRDAQIRMLLLTHFSKYVHVFTHDELSQHILPELLLGIKDTDDSLVAATLICLSKLVPILGAATVIGGKRSKFFSDGRPNSTHLQYCVESKIDNGKKTFPIKTLKEFPCTEEISDGPNEYLSYENILVMNERPSPVGGESVENEVIATGSSLVDNNMAEDDWDDWDNTSKHIAATEDLFTDVPLNNTEKDSDGNMKSEKEKPGSKLARLQKAAIEAKRNIVDIDELDIKNQKFDSSKRSADEFDFFADMMPVIEKPKVVSVSSIDDNSNYFGNKLNFIPNEATDDKDGWEENWSE